MNAYAKALAVALALALAPFAHAAGNAMANTSPLVICTDLANGIARYTGDRLAGQSPADAQADVRAHITDVPPKLADALAVTAVQQVHGMPTQALMAMLTQDGRNVFVASCALSFVRHQK